jgi:hypothetical protein
MTQHLHRVTAKSPQQRCRQHNSASTSRHSQVTSAMPSPSRLDIYIAPQPSHPGSIVASMTRHLHRATAKSPQQRCHHHDSISTSRHGQAPSPAWLGSIVASMTHHLHPPAAKSPRQCHRHQDSISTSRTTKLPWQRCHQYDSASISRNG